nr:TadE/TadG family type IV pilus assembly protein [Novosphingobium piscinae]
MRQDRRAISAVEFAMVAPVLSAAGLGTIELANMATTYMRVSQAAMMLADNASRAKQASGSGGAVMREFDVNDLFASIDLQYPGLQMYANGRVILSSLEQNNAGGQWIHWQRCRGVTTWASRYGGQGTGTATGTSFAGMGPTGNLLTADANSAIMFVEVYYQYRPIFFNVGSSTAPVIYRSAAVYVRDDRDLTGGSPYPGAGLANPSPTSSRSSC